MNKDRTKLRTILVHRLCTGKLIHPESTQRFLKLAGLLRSRLRLRGIIEVAIVYLACVEPHVRILVIFLGKQMSWCQGGAIYNYQAKGARGDRWGLGMG